MIALLAVIVNSTRHWPISPLLVPVLLVDSTWLYQRRAMQKFDSQRTRHFSFVPSVHSSSYAILAQLTWLWLTKLNQGTT